MATTPGSVGKLAVWMVMQGIRRPGPRGYAPRHPQFGVLPGRAHGSATVLGRFDCAVPLFRRVRRAAVPNSAEVDLMGGSVLTIPGKSPGGPGPDPAQSRRGTDGSFRLLSQVQEDRKSTRLNSSHLGI